jgi:hypothetical protein
MGIQSDKTISFRSQLAGSLSDFLKDEGFECAATCSAVTVIVSELSHYKEEGRALWPDIYLCNDIRRVSQLLPGCSFIRIGQGTRSDETAIRALRECGPLARKEWSIFIERLDDRFDYGILGTRDFILSLTAAEVLIDGGEQTVPVVLIAKLGETCVEIRGAQGNRLCIHFSSVREDSPSPRQAIAALARGIAADVHPKYQAAVERFFYVTLSSVFQEAHGTLAVVIPKKRRGLPNKISDAIKLAQPVSLVVKIQEYLECKDHESLAELQRVGLLIEGMLESDGITVFRSDGSIMGYRAFLRGPKKMQKYSKHHGGARMRTYQELKQLADRGEIEGAFIHSQDGYTQFYRRKSDE